MGDAGVLIDPDSVPEIANAIKKILQDQIFKQGLVRKGGLARAQYFKTQQVAKEMYDFFKTVESSCHR